MFEVPALKDDLRKGRWIKDEEERKRLLERVKTYEQPLMEGIMKWAKPIKTRMLDHRTKQGEAFLELAALGGIGASWLLSKEYVDDDLFADIIDIIEYDPDSLQFSHVKAKFSAAILLFELSQLPDSDDYIPQILAAYPKDSHLAEAVDPKIKPNVEIDLIQWYFSRLWKIIDDERVRDFLVRMLDEDTTITPAGKRDSIAGPGYYAAELLLFHGEEHDIATLVPAVLGREADYIGHVFFKRAYEFLKSPNLDTTVLNPPVKKRSQIALLSKYLIQELESEDLQSQIRAAEVLALIDDKEAVNNHAIPVLLSLLGTKSQGLKDALSVDAGNRRAYSERALNELEVYWTPPPFIDALGHEDKHVRLFAIKALSKIGDRSIIPALQPLLEDEDRKIRKKAQNAIKRLQK
jgi:hypothetical protein